MTVQQLRRLREARPFEPFALWLGDGRRIPVEHPEFLAIFPGGRTLFVAQPDESFDIIDLLPVTSLHVGDGKPKRGRKGRPRP